MYFRLTAYAHLTWECITNWQFMRIWEWNEVKTPPPGTAQRSFDIETDPNCANPLHLDSLTWYNT
jgi:hypothetical protein